MDIDFLAQYLMLYHAPNTQGAQVGAASEIFLWLLRSGKLAAQKCDELLSATQFLVNIFNMLRLCSDDRFDESNAPQGLKKLLVQSSGEKDFESVRQRLIDVEQTVFAHYIECLKS
jgi:glutamine synthetase adenylyltransferase